MSDLTADTATLDALLDAFYAGVSGPAGRRWDRARERNLYLPGAHLVRVVEDESGRPTAQSMDLESFMDGTDEFFAKESFYEREIARHVDRFGNLAQVFTTYEARHEESDPEPFKRGINSLQLFWDGTRWWITAALWANESAEHPLPAEFLPKD
jgi:hypothetical protein